MGFSMRVDYKTNRALNLDRTYQIIRVAVEQAGLECIRADDMVQSGVIDKPTFQNLQSPRF
jgi:hypothetical protein